MKIVLLSMCLGLTLSSNVHAQATAPAPAVTTAPVRVRSESYYRTELFMGMSIPGGAMVSDADWERFLSDFVTLRFPEGFSVLTGRGQYREASGTIAKEPSHVLVFLYKKADRKAAGVKIEQIRAEYKKRFGQESVLRVDVTKPVSVSF